MSNKNIFPKNFLWGASTASHQVEGGTVNQWSVWELAHAKELANTAAERLSHLVPDWEEVKKQAENPSNYVSGRGVDHYNRYLEDFDIAKRLNLSAFRFGVEWSRLEPEEGQWDEEAVEHYRTYINGLKKRGLEPFLNIWHWTVPLWFDKKGGFTKRANLKYFNRFVQKIADEYGSQLSYVITLNEPNVYTTFGYITGEWPPQERKPFKAIVVYSNLISAHKKAYKLLKRAHPHLQIGIAAQLANVQAKRPHNIVDESVTKIMRYAWNWFFLRRIRRQQDFVGFNYYYTDYYKNWRREDPRVPVNDLGWYMEPEGLYPLLLRTWAHYHKPIFVTENGLADSHDNHRQWWLEETMLAMERAISEGVDVRGYFHWSLLDNFEWKYGWWPKFGLVEVDRNNGMKRTIRTSAHWWAQEIKKRSS
ncbi:MAG TPA: glycoside hydrolase family 1 protein [Patescibacteria group bacterium]|nr:glycoside hydrolase family 1 protein [Patescibacteria group bacterium]